MSLRTRAKKNGRTMAEQAEWEMSSRQNPKIQHSLLAVVDGDPLGEEAAKAFDPNGYLYMMDPVAIQATPLQNYFTDNPDWLKPVYDQPADKKDGVTIFAVGEVRQEFPSFGSLCPVPLKIHATLVGMIYPKHGMLPMLRIICDRDINKISNDSNAFRKLGMVLWDGGFSNQWNKINQRR